jgi:endonuclease/exonuclease/phosphatase family metal-dependent hydrolase
MTAAMIVVASYNIRKAIGSDRRRRPDRILEVLGELDADIVALQEADRRFGARASAIPVNMLADHSAYRPVPFDVRPGSIGWHGNALLVRKSAEIIHHTHLHLPALEPRGAVLADIRINGAEIRVVGMHLDLSGLWRRRQAHAILAHLEAQPTRLPTVMMGDLNEWRRLGGCLHDFAQRHHIAPTGPSFHARQPVARLDRIIVSPGVAVEETGVHSSLAARTASDHLPIWARLRF